ncbi:MAG: hypothetical protein WDA59_00170 [Methanofastidiosum sp.]
MTTTIALPAQKLDWTKCIPTKATIQKYPYIVLKIIPYKTSYTSKDFEKILNTISKYHNPFLKRFEIRDRILIYHPPQPFCYEVLFTHEKVTYSFAIPEVYKTLFVNKIRFILSNCDIVEVSDHLINFEQGIKQNFKYDKSWILSLNTNENINLNDNLIVLSKDLQANDKVLLQYVFQPMFDWDWKNNWQSKFLSYSQHGNIRSTQDIFGIIDCIFDFLLLQLDLFLNGLMCAVCGEESLSIKEEKVNFAKDLSDATKHKTLYDGFKTNINVYYRTNENITAGNISRNVATILKDVEGDNSLKLDKTKQVSNKQIQRVSKNAFITSTKEAVQFIKTPGERTLKEYEDMLDKINIADIETPQELLNGDGIPLGELQKGSKFIPITFGTDVNSNNKPVVYLSPQEGGKSSFLRMYGVEAVSRGDSIFAFDTIDGKTIEIIRDYLPVDFPEEKIIILDFRNNQYAFPLMWNELFDDYKKQLQKAKDEFDHYQIMENFSDTIGSELVRFIDTFQAEDRQNRLTPNMRSYLVDLAQLVFMNGGNFGMIKDCLYDRTLRYKLLSNLKLPRHLSFCQNILKIDSEDSSTTFRGIETRLNLIMENATLKKYFSLNGGKKLDFAHWANNGYCVLIQIPEQFSDPIITFLVQKLWLAIKTSRYNIKEENRPNTKLLVDEPNRFQTIMNLLNDHLIASRKWHLQFLFFIHNINVFREARDNLKNAGTTFIMLPTSQFNFAQVSEFYAPMGFEAMKEVEKQISRSGGKRRFALVALHYKNVWYPCLVRLPIPIEQRNKYVDRKYLNEKCAKLYGVSQRDYYKTLFKKQKEDAVDRAQVQV